MVLIILSVPNILDLSMFQSIRKVLILAAASLTGVITLPANAQTPGWIPVAELLIGSMGNSNYHQMVEVMNRCTALNMTLSALTAKDSPEVSQGYENQALTLIQNGIMIEMNTETALTGLEPDIDDLSGKAVDAVKGMLATYNQWMDENYDDSGSYFSNDLEIEMKGCELATKFVVQMSAR